MKNKHIILPAILFAVIALVSCDTRTKTVSKLEGIWTSVPEKLPDNDTLSVDMINAFQFLKTSDVGGDVVISSMISIEEAVPATDSIVSPYAVTGAAVASVTGTFEAVSYDHIMISLDPSTYSFSIDSAAIRYQFDFLNSAQVPEVDALKPAYADRFRQSVAPEVKKAVMALTDMNSVKFTKSMMAANINGIDITLRRQSAE